MESLKVGDYMNHRPVTFNPDMTVAEAVERLLNGHQTGGPVIDEQKRLLGFLSEQDCLTKMLESSYYREQVARVKDVMRKDVLSVKPYASIIELGQQMLGVKPKVYPVVDDDGLLLGVITRANVLKAIDIQLHAGYERAG
ncbi:CBS domain-containing protein [Aliiglaciecola sp. CAU 1673]|uniref:CBS domain-containing protein n=1 Tax=Aliiglaciecola sp. CAU 1673 TaxID=3032595 RepID=UPI0023DAD1DA|nr:CBS domain-containing protein [Aliiglaciecola sp. CAU 1673]MDF2177580.1 CBS domain-containing protein [Aliiglaciecola sp. CAU 1673]